MVTQTLLDFLSGTFAFYLNQLPAMPVAFNEGLLAIGSVGTQLGSTAAKFGGVIPWDAISLVLAWFQVLCLYWFGALGIRLFLWLGNR